MIFVRQRADLTRNTTQTRIRLKWYSIRSKPRNAVLSVAVRRGMSRSAGHVLTNCHLYTAIFLHAVKEEFDTESAFEDTCLMIFLAQNLYFILIKGDIY
jgi:hypothetical protein